MVSTNPDDAKHFKKIEIEWPRCEYCTTHFGKGESEVGCKECKALRGDDDEQE